jgi:hypothetical protein
MTWVVSFAAVSDSLVVLIQKSYPPWVASFAVNDCHLRHRLKHEVQNSAVCKFGNEIMISAFALRALWT